VSRTQAATQIVAHDPAMERTFVPAGS